MLVRFEHQCLELVETNKFGLAVGGKYIHSWPGVAGASGAVARAALHVTTWLTPRHPHANRTFPAGEMLADPLL